MPQNNPQPGEIYRHFKNREEQIIARAKHSETGEDYVVYQALYGTYQTYVRPYQMFTEQLDHSRYPDTDAVYRFTLVGCVGETYLADSKQASGIEDRASVEQESISEERNVRGVFSNSVVTQNTSEDWTSDKSNRQDASEPAVNKHFLQFLDADYYSEKYEILSDMESELDDHLINQMAASIDEVIPDGPLYERVTALRSCLRTKARFETRR